MKIALFYFLFFFFVFLIQSQINLVPRALVTLVQRSGNRWTRVTRALGTRLVTNRRLGLKTHAQVILSLHGFAWVGHFLVDDFRVFRRKTQLFEMVHRKKNCLGILTREYPATPKVTLERVDTWLRRYKMVNTRMNTIGATWLPTKN